MKTYENGKIVTEYKTSKGIILRKVETKHTDESMTSQADAKEADVNFIMSKYIKTGIPPEFRQGGLYADVSEIPDLSTMLDTVSKAQTAFDLLDSKTREFFGNSPVNMVNFLGDSSNREQAEKLGLLAPKPIPESPIKVEVTNPQPPKETPVSDKK